MAELSFLRSGNPLKGTADYQQSCLDRAQKSPKLQSWAEQKLVVARSGMRPTRRLSNA
jgi:hypothetical protein